eukprot:gene540-8052_t
MEIWKRFPYFITTVPNSSKQGLGACLFQPIPVDRKTAESLGDLQEVISENLSRKEIDMLQSITDSGEVYSRETLDNNDDGSSQPVLLEIPFNPQDSKRKTLVN